MSVNMDILSYELEGCRKIVKNKITADICLVVDEHNKHLEKEINSIFFNDENRQLYLDSIFGFIGNKSIKIKNNDIELFIVKKGNTISIDNERIYKHGKNKKIIKDYNIRFGRQEDNFVKDKIYPINVIDNKYHINITNFDFYYRDNEETLLKTLSINFILKIEIKNEIMYNMIRQHLDISNIVGELICNIKKKFIINNREFFYNSLVDLHHLPLDIINDKRNTFSCNFMFRDATIDFIYKTYKNIKWFRNINIIEYLLLKFKCGDLNKFIILLAENIKPKMLRKINNGFGSLNDLQIKYIKNISVINYLTTTKITEYERIFYKEYFYVLVKTINN